SFPNFEGLHYVCADCHQSGHPGWGGEDCVECHDPAATWSEVVSVWDQHTEIWDMYKGDHREVECRGCHFEGFEELDPSCDSCHSLPEDHDANSTYCWICH
ncbi:MAG: cytochrome c3 family protein, partial [Anaerolineae bacterium]